MIIYEVHCYDCNTNSLIIVEKPFKALHCPNCSTSRPVYRVKDVPMAHDINEFKGHIKG